MAVSSFDLNVSYGQLAIFWSTLPQPFNDWTDQHVGQGFAWRPGSASFRTLIESGIHTVDVNLVDQALPVSSDAVRVIEVPFDVPADGAIEVASISDSVPLTLPAGMYQLRCEFFLPRLEVKPRVRLVLLRTTAARFALLRADDGLSVDQPLLTNAEPAAS